MPAQAERAGADNAHGRLGGSRVDWDGKFSMRHSDKKGRQACGRRLSIEEAKRRSSDAVVPNRAFAVAEDGIYFVTGTAPTR